MVFCYNTPINIGVIKQKQTEMSKGSWTPAHISHFSYMETKKNNHSLHLLEKLMFGTSSFILALHRHLHNRDVVIYSPDWEHFKCKDTLTFFLSYALISSSKPVPEKCPVHVH
jgi:hypothetical protein